ncbi:MAG: FAD-dependent oxidoreductase [Chloroflexota bacterium]
MRVVVCGGGVIGASTAYFLSRRGADVTVVERAGVACASSGKAGAFLALDWCVGSPLDALARRSFALHAQLPGEIDADWGYHRVTTYSGFAAPFRETRGRGSRDLSWLSDDVVVSGQIGSPQTTAMVHPRLFTEALIGAAQARGAELRIGTVTGIVRNGDGSTVRGVELDGEEILEADAVVVAMGPWSILAAGWLPLPMIQAYKGHSVIYETGQSVPGQALFLEFRESSGAVVAPELFPRSDGTTYIAFSATQDALPIDPLAVRPDAADLARLESICERVSPAFAPDKIVARQACYRPVTRDGLPLIGKVPGIDGAFVATGHSVWGVLNGPATGEALAELVVDGAATSTNLRPFDPGRLRPLDPASVRIS